MVSHKRKTERKIKKNMKKQVQKAKAKRDDTKPNQDKELMLKLMAMMNGGRGTNQPMDAAPFLKLKEEVTRTKAISLIAKQIIDNGTLVLEAKKMVEDSINADIELPRMLEG